LHDGDRRREEAEEHEPPLHVHGRRVGVGVVADVERRDDLAIAAIHDTRGRLREALRSIRDESTGEGSDSIAKAKAEFLATVDDELVRQQARARLRSDEHPLGAQVYADELDRSGLVDARWDGGIRLHRPQ